MGRKQEQYMHAPGLIYAPEKRDNTAKIMVFAFILFLCLLGCICSSIFSLSQGTARYDNTQQIAVLGIILLSSPLWGAVLFIFLKLWLAGRKRTAQDALRESQYFVEDAEYARQQQAARAITNAPEIIDGPGGAPLAIMGAPIIGDLAWCYANWFTLPPSELAKHGVIIGGSGTGKTVSLLRLAYIAATIYGYRVFFIDGKGDRDTAAQFLATMMQANIKSAMFPRMQYNGWRGDGTAILNRLMAIVDFSEPYYEDATRDVLTYACLNHPSGPPVNSADLLKRLNTILAHDAKNRTVEGVVLRYRSFFGALQNSLDGNFSWEDTRAAYMLLDGLALKKQAASLGRFLIEDFAHYAARRKQQGRDLLIIDEYSAISNGSDAANLIERIRSYGCAVLLSSQSYAGLGEDRDAQRILDAANFLLLHRTAAPEKLTERAGTQQAMKEIRQFGGNLDEQIYEKGRAQFEEEHALHPDQARRLDIGEALMIAHGRYLKAKIAPAPQPAPAIVAQARAWIDQQPTAPAIPTQRKPAPQSTLQQPSTPLVQIKAPQQPTAPAVRKPAPQQPNQQPPHPPELL